MPGTHSSITRRSFELPDGGSLVCYECDLLNLNDEFHLWMDRAADREGPCFRKGDLEPGSRLLITGIETESGGFQIGMMQKISIVIDDRDHFTPFDRHFSGLELPSLLGNRLNDAGKHRSCHSADEKRDESQSTQRIAGAQLSSLDKSHQCTRPD